MKMFRFLKGLFGFCQAKGCRKHSVYCADIKSGGKKIGSAKLCENHTITLFKAKEAPNE